MSCSVAFVSKQTAVLSGFGRENPADVVIFFTYRLFNSEKMEKNLLKCEALQMGSIKSKFISSSNSLDLKDF